MHAAGLPGADENIIKRTYSDVMRNPYRKLKGPRNFRRQKPPRAKHAGAAVKKKNETSGEAP
jgi:hypothetical protein